MATSTGVPQSAVDEFDSALFRFTEGYCTELDRLRVRHNLTDADIAALLRERFGDIDDVWSEWAKGS